MLRTKRPQAKVTFRRQEVPKILHRLSWKQVPAWSKASWVVWWWALRLQIKQVHLPWKMWTWWLVGLAILPFAKCNSQRIHLPHGRKYLVMLLEQSTSSLRWRIWTKTCKRRRSKRLKLLCRVPNRRPALQFQRDPSVSNAIAVWLCSNFKKRRHSMLEKIKKRLIKSSRTNSSEWMDHAHKMPSRENVTHSLKSKSCSRCQESLTCQQAPYTTKC